MDLESSLNLNPESLTCCVTLLLFSPSVVSDSFRPHVLQPHQDLLSMGFSRQEYWSGLSFPFPGYLPNPGIEPVSSELAGGLYTTKPPGKPPSQPYLYLKSPSIYWFTYILPVYLVSMKSEYYLSYSPLYP